MAKKTPSTDDAAPPIEWLEPPPPRAGRKAVDRPDAIAAGMKIRRMIEQDRRRRGIPREGIRYDGDEILQDKPGAEPYLHGVASTYRNYGCRCEPCKKA